MRRRAFPLRPRLLPMLVAHAPSKLKCPVNVPTTALRLTAVRSTAVPPYACGVHATVVDDVHDVLPHGSAAFKEAVGVRPSVPRLSPLMVTVPPPLGAMFVEAVLTTGAASATVGANQNSKSGERRAAHHRS